MQSKLDDLVGAVQAKMYREGILYSGAVVPSHLPQLLDLLKEITHFPLVTKNDLQQMHSIIEYELNEMRNKPEELLPEMAHGPAFYSENADGSDGTVFFDWNSIIGIPRKLETLSVEGVLEFWQKNFLSKNIVVVGAGMAQEELYSCAQQSFGGLEPPAVVIPSQEGKEITYVGGSNYVSDDKVPLVHAVVGFRGAEVNSDASFPLAVLQMLMGGGNSFSAGGPGKGMYSRLYTKVLNRYHWVDSCKVFNFSYSSTGLFGIHGSALPANARDLVQVLLEQLHGMTQPLTSIELDRAKNQVKSAVLMGLESRLTELEDLADQVSHTGTHMSPAQICHRIDSLSGNDIQSAALRLLDSNPTVVAYGPLQKMPSYNLISKWHNAARPDFLKS